MLAGVLPVDLKDRLARETAEKASRLGKLEIGALKRSVLCV